MAISLLMFKNRIGIPLICDIHFDYKMALAALDHPVGRGDVVGAFGVGQGIMRIAPSCEPAERCWTRPDPTAPTPSSTA